MVKPKPDMVPYLFKVVLRTRYGSSSCGESSGDCSLDICSHCALRRVMDEMPSGVGGTTDILGTALNGSFSSRVAFGTDRKCEEPINLDDQSSTFDISLVDLMYSFSFRFWILLSRIGCTLQFMCCQFGLLGIDCSSATLFRIRHFSFRISFDVRITF